MKTIHKFHLNITDSQPIMAGNSFTPLCVQTQNGVPTLWAEVDDEEPKTAHTIKMIGTGHEIKWEDGRFIYLATIQIDVFVWHIYY
jgi:hypothetical protein